MSGRYDLAAGYANGLLVIAGGRNGNLNSNQVNIYNTTDGTWTVSSLPGGSRHGLAAASTDKYVVFAGGISSNMAQNAVDVFDTFTKTCSDKYDLTLSSRRGFLS